jgi:hypothetical protein
MTDSLHVVQHDVDPFLHDLVLYDTGPHGHALPNLCPTRHSAVASDLGVPPEWLRRIFCDRNRCIFCGPRKARALAHAVAEVPVRHEALLTLVDAPADTYEHAALLRKVARKIIRTSEIRGYFVVEAGNKRGKLHAHLALAGTSQDSARIRITAEDAGLTTWLFGPRPIRDPLGFASYMLKGAIQVAAEPGASCETVRAGLDAHLQLNARRLLWAAGPAGERPWARRDVPLPSQSAAIAAVRRDWRRRRFTGGPDSPLEGRLRGSEDAGGR